MAISPSISQLDQVRIMSRTGSRSSAELRAAVRERDGDDCFVCRKPIDFARAPGTLWGPSLEHVVPIAAGGSRSDLGNLRLSHAYPCNKAKGARHEGTDYSQRPVPRRANPNDVCVRRHRSDLLSFEAWSAARS
jgi:5-methylcytosine-specific restriction endonuclease McrA